MSHRAFGGKQPGAGRPRHEDPCVQVRIPASVADEVRAKYQRKPKPKPLTVRQKAASFDLQQMLAAAPVLEDLGAASCESALQSMTRVMTQRGCPVWDLTLSLDDNLRAVCERIKEAYEKS